MGKKKTAFGHAEDDHEEMRMATMETLGGGEEELHDSNSRWEYLQQKRRWTASAPRGNRRRSRQRKSLLNSSG